MSFTSKLAVTAAAGAVALGMLGIGAGPASADGQQGPMPGQQCQPPGDHPQGPPPGDHQGPPPGDHQGPPPGDHPDGPPSGDQPQGPPPQCQSGQ
ncbi:hypothetical protein [Nocardia anaemiae]|uniref:hypothetical protein n=1 Tax=Nocardia anaemiae TaxID=263910 RepID=UPI0007A3C310|nr:hypothetical protein [Nocardia anaemiae]